MASGSKGLDSEVSTQMQKKKPMVAGKANEKEKVEREKSKVANLTISDVKASGTKALGNKALNVKDKANPLCTIGGKVKEILIDVS